LSLRPALFLQRAALHLHLVRGLPGADDHFADAAHGLRVRRHHREGAEVVQDVLGGDGLARMRLSAKATSSAIAGSRWWQTISMSRCSSMVLTV
jgi:hypothetical protein